MNCFLVHSGAREGLTDLAYLANTFWGAKHWINNSMAKLNAFTKHDEMAAIMMKFVGEGADCGHCESLETPFIYMW